MPREKLPFYPGLEGLRGLSVAAVLLFHTWPAALPGGFLGVSTFFTLSGFLITGLLFEEWRGSGRIGFADFWGRRLRRLLPASLLGLAAIAAGTALWGNDTQQARIAGDGISALFYFANWWLIATGADYDSLMGSPSPVQHFWSLSIEEQYYLLYPLLTAVILLIARGSRRIFAAVLFAAALSSWIWMAVLGASDVATARVYYGTDTRCAELLAGGFLALVLAGGKTVAPGRSTIVAQSAGVLGLVVTALAWRLARVESVELYSWGLPVYTLSTLSMIASALRPRGALQKLLSSAPLRWLGRISYGLYVYHWPVLLWFTAERTGLHPAIAGVFGVGLSLGLAAASLRWIETPVRSRQWFVGRWALVAGPTAVALVALAVVATAAKWPAEVVTEVVSQLVPAAPEVHSARRGRLHIAVAGDSVARDIGEGLVTWAGSRSNGPVVANLAGRGCGIAIGAWSEGTRSRRACDQWPLRARAKFKTFSPDVVVVVTSGWDLVPRQLPGVDGPRRIGDPIFDRWLVGQYGDALQVFYGAGARVVWLTSPCVRQPDRATEELDITRRWHMNNVILPTVAAEHGAGKMTIIDLFGEICPNDRFAKSLHDMERFRSDDGRHFTVPAKRWLGAWLGDQLVELNAR